MQSVEFQVCRGCLATDTRMVDTRKSFDSDVIRLVALLPTSKVGLPPCVCYECLAQLTKMRDFHAKNRRAYNVLLKILQQRGRIEGKDIKQIDRNQQSLTSPLKFHQIESISIEPKLFYSDGAVEDRKDEIIPELISMHNDLKIEFSPEDKIKNDDWFEDFNNFSDDNQDDISTIDITLNIKVEKESVKETEQVKVETERKKGKNVKSQTKSRKRKTSKENSKQEPGAEDQKVPKVKKKQAPRKPDKVDPMKCHYTEDFHSFATVTVMTEEERLEVFKQRREKQKYIDANYKCTDCYLGFTSTETYEKHRKKHNSNIGEYVCPLCKYRYKTQKLQLKHIAMVHRTKFECKYCTHVCTSGQQAKIHSEKHSSATYGCQECSYITTHLASYNLHVSTMHGEEAPCPCCGVSFLDFGAMRTHLVSAHPKCTRTKVKCECGVVFYNSEARKLHRSTSSKHTPDGSTLLHCALCDSRFTDKESLKTHMHTHSQEQKEAAARSHPRNMTCDQCGEVVSGRTAYRMHYSLVHPDKALTCFPSVHYPDMLCDICGKIIKGLHSLTTHRFLHSELRPFECKICDKRFPQRINFDLHMNIHTKKNFYKCGVCGKGFNNSANRNRHKLVHTQEKKFSCDICGKSFKSRGEKLNHTRYVHMKQPWPKRNRSKRIPTQRQQYIDKESSD